MEIERSREWKAGYATGVRHTKNKIWNAVYEYVHRHNADKAYLLKKAVDAITKELETTN